jgi:hypothetical protein
MFRGQFDWCATMGAPCDHHGPLKQWNKHMATPLRGQLAIIADRQAGPV